MIVILSRPEGAALKEMAEALGWKENSIRGAMSAYAKKRPAEPSPPKRKTASGLITLRPTLKLSFNKKGADYRPLNYFV